MKSHIKSLISILLAVIILCSTVLSNSVVLAVKNDNSKDITAIENYIPSDVEHTAVSLGFIPVISNKNFTLFYKQETAEIAVYNRNQNEVIYSNPQDVSDEITGVSYHRMKSQLYVTYYVNNTQAKYYSSYYDSVSYGQAKAKIKDDSFIVEYTFGKENYSKEMLPIAIPKDKFEKKILPKLSDEDKEIVENSYKHTSIKDAKTEVARKKLIERYKNIEDTELYVLDRYIPDYDVPSVYKSLFSVYTKEDFVEDNSAAGGTTKVTDTSIIFTLSLIYSLTNDGLSVSLDCSKLKKTESADIDQIAILEFFGSGGKNDSGYSLIPDGSGGVISFNSDKQWASAYSARIYGNDGAISYLNASTDKPVLQLPMFAIAKNNAGILAVAENGAELCSIVSDIADGAIPYNRTSFSANVYAYDKMHVLNPEYGGGTSEIYVREETPYNKRIDINYYFLQNGKNSYADIAARYRDILISDGVLAEKLTGEIPFVFELVGAVDVKKKFLGIPYTGYEVLTSFEQAEEIINSFSKKGIEDIKVKYSGWFNGGIRQTDISKVSVLSCLGGKKDLNSLMKNKKADIYPEINVSQVTNKLFDNFSVKNDAVRLTYNETALIYPISLSRNTFDYDAKYTYLLSPSKYSERIKNFTKKYTHKNLALSDLASTLNSDFSPANYTNRITAKKNVEDSLKHLSKKASIMASAPNKYAIRFTDIMVDMPLGTMDANIFDAEIPFVQMVLSGYKDMACEPINISDNEDDLLTLMAYNTLPNYTMMYAKSSVLKDTDYAHLYSLNFKDWQKKSIKLYTSYIKDMQKVRGCTVTGWEILAEDVIKITYDNGAVFVINKSEQSFAIQGTNLENGSYAFFEEGL